MWTVAYGLPRWAAPAFAVVGLIVAGVAVGLDDQGRVLAGIAALAAIAAAGWLFGGPVLRAGPGGVAVRGWIGTRTAAWTDVERVLVDARRRSAAIEIETVDELLVVPALLLGRVRPAEVAQELARLRGALPERPPRR